MANTQPDPRAGLPEWVHLTPGPMGTIYCAVIAGECSGPYRSASEAIAWGQKRIERNRLGPVRVTDAVARSAWGDRVIKDMERAA